MFKTTKEEIILTLLLHYSVWALFKNKLKIVSHFNVISIYESQKSHSLSLCYNGFCKASFFWALDPTFSILNSYSKCLKIWLQKQQFLNLVINESLLASFVNLKF